jgi:hypothetical protein
MRLSRWWGILLTVLVVAAGSASPAFSAQGQPSLAGRWTLNRTASQFPPDMGFGADLMSSAGSDSGVGGGRGAIRGGGGASRAIPRLPESEDDVNRARQLTEEARNPPAHLTITQAATSVTIADDGGHTRTFETDGREQAIQLDGVVVAATARWEGGTLVVLYKVEPERDLRYDYSCTMNPRRLVVDVRFLERNGHDSARRVYESSRPDEEASPASAPAPAPATNASGVPPTAANPGQAGQTPKPATPPVPTSSTGLTGRPGSEFQGLTKLGIEVDVSSGGACGVDRQAIETTVSKSLTDAGLTVVPETTSDVNTYIYVNVVTGSPSTGLCVSRYDVYLYTYANASLSYHQAPVLIQVSLAHSGGLAGATPSALAGSVLHAIKQYVDQIAGQIRDANK